MTDPETEAAAEDRALVRSLEAGRPTPAPAFRGALARRLAGLDPGYGHRPERLWLHAGALAGAGAVLILIGLLVSTGAI